MNSKKTRSKYTNDEFVPIKSITNGVIVLDNNEKVTGIKIMPRNIFILDYATQDAIIDNLKNVYNIIDYEFWIIAADRPVDINVYLSQLQLLVLQLLSLLQATSINENESSKTEQTIIKSFLMKASKGIFVVFIISYYYIFFNFFKDI